MKENSIGDRIEEKYTRYINCETDILELTIEEAIFILEKDTSVHYVEDLLQEAYKVILSDYKRVLKENEELKNGTRRNENELEVGIDYNWDALKKALDEAEKTNEYIIYDNGKWIKEKYCVPIKKIKDKIEDLYKEDRKMTEELLEPDSNFKNIDRNLKRIKNQTEVLKGLLESEEN